MFNVCQVSPVLKKNIYRQQDYCSIFVPLTLLVGFLSQSNT